MAGKEGRKIYRSARWRVIREFVLERDGFACQTCNRRSGLEVDHKLGFYPARADTSEKAHLGPGGVSWQSEGSTARSLNVRRSG